MYFFVDAWIIDFLAGLDWKTFLDFNNMEKRLSDSAGNEQQNEHLAMYVYVLVDLLTCSIRYVFAFPSFTISIYFETECSWIWKEKDG